MSGTTFHFLLLPCLEVFLSIPRLLDLLHVHFLIMELLWLLVLLVLLVLLLLLVVLHLLHLPL
jgi:hypothetical protein